MASGICSNLATSRNFAEGCVGRFFATLGSLGFCLLACAALFYVLAA